MSASTLSKTLLSSSKCAKSLSSLVGLSNTLHNNIIDMCILSSVQCTSDTTVHFNLTVSLVSEERLVLALVWPVVPLRRRGVGMWRIQVRVGDMGTPGWHAQFQNPLSRDLHL